MIDLSAYTKEAILKEMLDEVDDSFDKREGSLINTALGPVAWEMEGGYMLLGRVQDAANPYTATGTDLDYFAGTRNLTRKAATPAVREGTFDAVIPSGSQFKTINGADSVIFVSGDLISSGGGTYVYELTCAVAGTIGNSYIGAILPVTAISGLTSAYIGAILINGTEEETDSALRERYFDSFESQAYNGNIATYRQAILAISGVGAVQVYPASQYNGGGTTYCSILDTNLEPASQTLIDTVQNTICPPDDGTTTPSPNGYGIAPVGAAVTIGTGTEVAINIAATVTMATGETLADHLDEIKEEITKYIESVRESWGNALLTRTVNYPVVIYAARLIYAILNVSAVVNVSSLTVNGSSSDLALTETSALQQVPVAGTITVS